MEVQLFSTFLLLFLLLLLLLVQINGFNQYVLILLLCDFLLRSCNPNFRK